MRVDHRLGLVAVVVCSVVLVTCTQTPAVVPTPTVSATWKAFGRVMSPHGVPISLTQEKNLTRDEVLALGALIRRFWIVSLDKQLDDYRATGVDPMQIGPLCYVLTRFEMALAAMSRVGTLADFVAVADELSSLGRWIQIAGESGMNPRYGPWPPRGTFIIEVPPAERPPAERMVPAGVFNSSAACVSAYSGHR